MAGHIIAGGPYFEDLDVGQVFDSAPSVTLSDGRAAAHHVIVGNRVRLALDAELSRQVTGGERPFASPGFVWDVAIGQSTLVTHRVLANLFYRGVAFHRAPSIGDTLRTTTKVVGLKQNSSRPSGLTALEMTTVDQQGGLVLRFWRCAMIPLRDPSAQTGRADDLSLVGAPPEPAALTGLTRGWDLARYRESVAGPHAKDIEAGSTWQVDGGDVVTSAPELARLTGNVASVHHDATASGKRLVYGGHTIGLALTQTTRALPALVTVAGWHSCDHVGPVYEGDTLFSTVTAEQVEPLPDGGALVHLRSEVRAIAPDATDVEAADPRPVLDWRYIAVFA